MAMEFQALVDHLKLVKSVALTAPAGADGDSVGTQCALFEYIQKEFPAVQCYVINEDPCPDRYTFLKHSEKFLCSKDFQEESPELWIVVDGGANRLGEKTTPLWDAAKYTGQIDHHAVSGSTPYTFTLNDATAAATTEIVYKFFVDQSYSWSATEAQALYVGLIYDTGLFKHSNTTPEIMRIGAKLLESDFNHTDTAEKALLLRSEKNLKLLKELLDQSVFCADGKGSIGTLNHATLSKIQADSNDKDGLIDILFLTPHCRVASLLFEIEPEIWKVSFRSRGPNVAKLAQSLDEQGGGHILAAGCTLKGKQEKILSVCQNAIEEIVS